MAPNDTRQFTKTGRSRACDRGGASGSWMLGRARRVVPAGHSKRAESRLSLSSPAVATKALRPAKLYVAKTLECSISRMGGGREVSSRAHTESRGAAAMPRAVHRGRVRLQSYVDPATADRVDRFCAAMGMSESALVKSALDQYLAGTSDAALVLRRLDRLGRAVERNQRDLELLSEAFAVYIRLWFAHTPNVPEDAKRGARMNAE